MTSARSRLTGLVAGLGSAALIAGTLLASGATALAAPSVRVAHGVSAVGPVQTQTASAPLAGGGQVSATLSYRPDGTVDHGISLAITRAGTQLPAPPVDTTPCLEACAVGQAPGMRALHVLDLAPGADPEILVDLYTGGAHCCTVTDFYTYSPATRSYRRSVHNWGDPGYRLERLDGAEVFATTNDAFAYAFTDYAASGEPVALSAWNGAKLVDVTRRHPGIIRHDAAGWLAAYRAQARQHYADTVGVIAAWAADEDELGHQAMVARFLRVQAADKRLNSSLAGVGLASNERFIVQLDRFLKRQGYLR